MKRKWIFTSIVVVIAIIIYIGIFMYSKRSNVNYGSSTEKSLKRNPSNTNIVIQNEPPDTIYKIYPDPERLLYGGKDSPVKILLFVDFSNEKSIRTIRIFKDIIGDNIDGYALYLYSFPIYQNPLSLPLSALFIRSIKEGALAEFVDFVLSKDELKREDILSFIKDRGIDPQEIFQQYKENSLEKLPALNDMNKGVNFGVKIPPTFFVNGMRIDGFKKEEDIKEILKAQEEKVAEMIKGGVPKSDIYNEIVKDGKEVAYKIKISDRTVNLKEAVKEDVNIYEEDLRFVPYHGNRYAPVTIVLFVDYECPYTKRFFPILKSTIQKYEGDVRLFIKHYPLSSHKRSLDVAKILASALMQRKFWVLFEKIMEHPGTVDEDTIFRLALEGGLDLDSLKSGKDSEKVRLYVENDMEKGRELGIKVLPTLYINGVRYEGVISANSLNRIIESEKKIAEKLLNQGVSYENLYDTIVRMNRLKNFSKKIEKPYIEKIR